MWCGEQDKNTPLRVAKLMTEQMPDAELHVVRDGTHFEMEEKVF